MTTAPESSDASSHDASGPSGGAGPVVILGAVVIAITVVLALLVGLNLVFAGAILLLYGLATWAISRWRAKRNPARSVRSFGALSSTGALAAVAVFVLIQAVPYGRSHANGAARIEPAWPDAQTRALAVRACYDCHSNEVKYPWYSNIAPISWLVSEHVDDGREALNFSDINHGGEGKDEVVDVVKEGSMPPAYFTRFGLHHTAKLSKAEMATLIAGLSTMPEFKEHGRG